MTHRPTRVLAIATAGLAIILMTAGCAATSNATASPTPATTSQKHHHKHRTDTASNNATATPSPTASTAVSSATGSGSTSSSSDDLCTTSDLQASLQATPGGGSAGGTGVDVVFHNVGPGTCTLQGFAGVSFVGSGNGTQIGAPATFDESSAHSTVSIAANSYAHATVLIADSSNYPSCEPQSADGFRIYPPGSTQSLYAPKGSLTLTACANSADKVLSEQGIEAGS
jgi:hypothetical protein